MKNIYLIGFMGSGKSYFGLLIAQMMNLKYIRLDTFIEESNKMSIPEIFEIHGEKIFREMETNALIMTGLYQNHIISCGGGTPCYNENMDWISQNGISIYLNASEDLLYKRLNREKIGRPLIKKMSNQELRKYISEKIKEREKFYLQSDYTIFQEDNEDAFEMLLFIIQSHINEF